MQIYEIGQIAHCNVCEYSFVDILFNKIKIMFNFIKFNIDYMKFPIHCPACDAEMSVVKLCCSSCETEVSGHFKFPTLMRLESEEQEFVIQFLMNSGSLKEMANKMGKSYPTVRNKLDELIAKMKTL